MPRAWTEVERALIQVGRQLGYTENYLTGSGLLAQRNPEVGAVVYYSGRRTKEAIRNHLAELQLAKELATSTAAERKQHIAKQTRVNHNKRNRELGELAQLMRQIRT